MISQENEFMQEATETLYELNADETIRQQCLARRDYYRTQNSYKKLIDEQAKELDEKSEKIDKLEERVGEQAKELDEKSEKASEAPYKVWAERGLMTLCEGNMVDYNDVTAWFARMRDEYQIDLWKLGYDRAMAGYWAEQMSNEFGSSVMEKVAQGPFTWSAPMKELGAMLSDHSINYGNNPILKWCLSNTGIKTTGSLDVIQPVKIQNKRRIDGLVSLLNAYVIYVKYREDYLGMV